MTLAPDDTRRHPGTSLEQSTVTVEPGGIEDAAA